MYPAKKLYPAFIMALLVCTVTVSAQKRTFDNFDRSQGVQVVSPPVRMVAASPKKLVKKTGKSSASSKTASVTDGLASRESLNAVSRRKLVMGANPHLRGFTTGNTTHDSYIVASSKKYGIDPLLIYAQMHQESSFKITATSNKGASGLMQLMPATARRFGVTKIYDPQQNIDAGIKYMRWLLDTFNGDVVLALAGYNAGEGAVMKYGWNVPPYRETQEYVRRITSRYNMISDPKFVQTASRLMKSKTAVVEQKAAAPLTVFEDAKAVKLPNGKMILMSR